MNRATDPIDRSSYTYTYIYLHASKISSNGRREGRRPRFPHRAYLKIGKGCACAWHNAATEPRAGNERTVIFAVAGTLGGAPLTGFEHETRLERKIIRGPDYLKAGRGWPCAGQSIVTGPSAWLVRTSYLDVDATLGLAPFTGSANERISNESPASH